MTYKHCWASHPFPSEEQNYALQVTDKKVFFGKSEEIPVVVSAVLEQSTEKNIKNITFRKGAEEYKEVTKCDTCPYRVVHTSSLYYFLYCLYV